MNTRPHRIAVLAGDGIGNEVMPEGLRVLDAAARDALAAFRRAAAGGDVSEALVAEFQRSPGGANLVALGMEADLPAAAAIDTLPLVPRLDPATGSLGA